jgi:hypothetical protein
MDRVIGTEKTNLDRKMIDTPHEVSITETKDKVMALENEGVETEIVDGDIARSKCMVCGEKFEGRRQAKVHAETGHIDNNKEIKYQLENVAIHGFEFTGFVGHGTTIRFKHQSLDVDIVASPKHWHEEGSRGLILGIQGMPNTIFEEYNGEPQKHIHQEVVTYEHFIKEVRDLIEDKFKADEIGEKDQ